MMSFDNEINILYIEDARACLQLVRILFQKQPINLLTATDGEEGLKLARLYKPSLILLDLDLPLIDGYDVFGHLKADEELADIPVIILSADSAPDHIERAYHIGVDDYFTKPVDLNQLLTCIDKYLPDGIETIKRNSQVTNVKKLYSR